MPFVDQGDKNSALFDIFAGRCKRRYHRIPFRWFLSFVGLNNTLVLFNMLSPAAPGLQKKWTNTGFGYKVIVTNMHTLTHSHSAPSPSVTDLVPR